MNLSQAERGCTCFQCPPCSFCTDMTDTERDIYNSEGHAALIRFVKSEPEEQMAEEILRGTTEILSTELTDEQREIFGL